MENKDRGALFLQSAEELVDKTNYKPQNSTVFLSNRIPEKDSEFEAFLFANYDICNFTRFKRNNKNWPEFLQRFVFSGVNCSSTEWPMQFWKFNGDSLTYRKKIQSVHEICEFISKAYYQLKTFQNILNADAPGLEKIYIKGCIWISGFKNGQEDPRYIANNISFQKNQFGCEYVGENIDEGFRLSACAKSSNLAVDPKIVYILSIYEKILVHNDKSCPEGFSEENFNSFLAEKVNTMNGEQIGESRKSLEKVIKNLFLMEFQHCKGVWGDRAYPIFWYVSDLPQKEFVYDDIVDGMPLWTHRINESDKLERDFEQKRKEIIKICAQVGVTDSIRSLLMYLEFFPDSAVSGEYIFDIAKMYYMITCVLISNGDKKGVLIFKRSNARHHLKNVWDLIPIKHARVKTKNNNSFVESYLKKMLMQELCIDDLDFKDDYQESITFEMDKKRNSVIPRSLCNIYRNGEVHNGILCVANIDIGNEKVDKFVEEIRNNLLTKSHKYSDIKLVEYDDVKHCDSEEEFDCFVVDGVKIRSLTLQEISDNSDNVCNDYKYVSEFNARSGESEYGISYLGYSIKQVLEKEI